MFLWEKINKLIYILILSAVFGYLFMPSARAELAPSLLDNALMGGGFLMLFLLVYCVLSLIQKSLQFLLNSFKIKLAGDKILNIPDSYVIAITFFIVAIIVLVLTWHLSLVFSAIEVLQLLLVLYLCKKLYNFILSKMAVFRDFKRYIAAGIIILIALPLILYKIYQDITLDQHSFKSLATCCELIHSSPYDYKSYSATENLNQCEKKLKEYNNNTNLKTIKILNSGFLESFELPIIALKEKESLLFIISNLKNGNIASKVILFNTKTNEYKEIALPAGGKLSWGYKNDFLLEGSKYLLEIYQDSTLNKNPWYIFNADTNTLEPLSTKIYKNIEVFRRAYENSFLVYFPNLRIIALNDKRYIQYFDLFSEKKYKPIKINEDKESLLAINYQKDKYFIAGVTTKTSLDLFDVKTNSIKPFFKLKYPIKFIDMLDNGWIFLVLNQGNDFIAVLNPKTKKVIYKQSDIPIDKYLHLNDGRILLVAGSQLSIFEPKSRELKRLDIDLYRIKAINIAPDTGDIVLIDGSLKVINPKTGEYKTFFNTSFSYDSVGMFAVPNNKIILGKRLFVRNLKYFDGISCLPEDNNIAIMEYSMQ